MGRRQVVLDGEIVALNEHGVPDFARLQNRMHVAAPGARLLHQIPVQYYVFDVPALGGRTLIDRPYTERRTALDGLGLPGGRIQVPPAFVDADPADVYATAIDQALEGVVCKRLDSAYQPGRRSPAWIKVPAQRPPEVVIIGWQPGEGRRAGMVGSLLLAIPTATGELAYGGKVGTGFTARSLHNLAEELGPLATGQPPISDVPRAEARSARWVRPERVGEVVFRTLTPSRRLRHTSWR